MHTSAVRAVIFDMDGVLTDSEPLINAAAVSMFKELGLEVHPSDFLPFVGAGEDRYLSGVAEKHRFPLHLPSAKRRTYDIYLQLVPAKLHAFPGAVDLVGQCRLAGLKIAVASSADRIKVEANLAKIGLPAETWDAVITGESVTHKKPAPDIFLAAASRLGVSPEQCLVIEDAVNGVEAGKAAGMRCWAVAHTFPADQLAFADAVYANIAQLQVSEITRELKHPDPLTTPPRISSLPPPELPWLAGTEPPALPAPRAWGFWASLGFGLLIGLIWMGTQVLTAGIWFGIITATGKQPDFETLDSDGMLLAITTLTGMPVAAGLNWIFASLRRGVNTREYLGLRRVSRRAWLTSTAALILFIVLSDGLTALLGRPIVPEVMVDLYRTAGQGVPLLFLAIVVGAPVAEEFLFRGFVFEGLSRSPFGGFGTIVLTSAVWASIHLQYDFYGMATVFAVGLLLGYVRLKTGSIYVTMALHALMNLVAFGELVVLHG